ncbi:MAG: hypothetical protein RLZZ499_2111 [Cyanobacteriota bacterium]|jgi:hypothetical protein
MEQIIFSLILFLIYFYILGTIFHQQSSQTSVAITNPPTVKLSYQQTLRILGKKGYNQLPEIRKGSVLQTTLQELIQADPQRFEKIYNELLATSY